MPRVDVGEMKKMTVTAVVTKATPTLAAQTKAENKQKRESGRRPSTVPAPALSSVVSFPPASGGVEGSGLRTPASEGWVGWDVRKQHPGGERGGSCLDSEDV